MGETGQERCSPVRPGSRHLTRTACLHTRLDRVANLPPPSQLPADESPDSKRKRRRKEANVDGVMQWS